MSRTKIIDQVYPGANQSFTTDISESGKSQHLNFANQVKECSQLTVDIAADRRRRCFRSKTTVTYTNEGTADAQDVKIKVLYPKYVVPISSEVPWTAKRDSALVFDIGLVRAGERKSFVITDSTICGNESIRGLSQCIQAFITPKSTCVVPSDNRAYASVAVAGSITNQEQTVTFSIANQGTEDMSDSTSYRVFANAALIKEGKVMLSQGEHVTLELPAQSVTYRLEADQVADHPGKSRPTASIQPSSVPGGADSIVVPTPIDAFYQDDADVDTDVSCLTIIDSYDPNDKQVSPQGITSRRYIKAEDDLKYLIRFQNTGTDVAYNVVVEDTISEHLDISSLRIGSASHPFTYTVSGKGRPVVTFTFKNINLPDDKADEPGSHGYIKFSIAQNPSNPDGTVIRNTAYNYFDYNSPIATNEVVNIIGDTVLASPVPLVVYECGKDEPTPAQAGAAIQLCETNQAVLQANQPAKGRGRWKLLSGQATIVNPESPTTALQDIGYGETLLEWSVTLCEASSRSQLKVNRFALPPAPGITMPDIQCEGDQLLPVTAEGSNIAWYEDAAKQHRVFAGNSFIPTVSATTTFYATQTVNGCESPVSAAVVRIHPNEVAVTATKDTLIAPQADSYQWFFEDQPLKGETSQKLLARNTGPYRVATVTNGCEAQSKSVMHVVQLPTSILKLSPNPTQDELLVAFVSNAIGEATITVRDQLGRRVMRVQVRKAHTVLEQQLDMGSLAPGMYFLDIRIQQEVYKAKLVKL
ncbi:T9SS type A sorting domain-containing protein [Pontibacter sp. E15-1]|uniref:DUF7619 domain-containing protein n=1 Tax=Pontibacter sp. E15-1 TaxID=2919918 RepID=UPI001F4F2247|nr:T9SS type A sorting domain-containing protein [Pontibacter sp. E15-1]MCJ8164689.1 T9SS type A sorting domain-containing protein [Pontibacter sp. E15-1]